MYNKRRRFRRIGRKRRNERRLIEAVITRRSWKPFGCKPTGVRIPQPPPKNTAKKDTFSAVFFYPNRRFGISSPHEVWWISSALWAVYHHASACIFLRLDDMQNFVLMICNFFEIDDMQGSALIYLWQCAIINSPKIQNLTSLAVRKSLTRCTHFLRGCTQIVSK